jgi:hypothetical protein
MNKSLAGALVATLCLALSQASCTTALVPASAPRISHGTVTSVDFDAVRGTYVLPNGILLELSGTRQRPMAALGERSAVALAAITPTTYEAVDGSLRLVFDTHANGVSTEVRVTYTPAAH